MGLKLKFEKQCNKKDTKRGGDTEIAAPLLRFALLLTGTGGWTSNCTWKRVRRGRGYENLFIYANKLPKVLTLPHLSDSNGGEIFKVAVQNSSLPPHKSWAHLWICTHSPTLPHLTQWFLNFFLQHLPFLEKRVHPTTPPNCSKTNTVSDKFFACKHAKA